MKRFLLFAYADYYPAGGMTDLRGTFDTLEEAQANAYSTKWITDNADIFDRVDGIHYELDWFNKKWNKREYSF